MSDSDSAVNPWLSSGRPGITAGPARSLVTQPDEVPTGRSTTAVAHTRGSSQKLPVEARIPTWSRRPHPHLGGTEPHAADANWWWLGVHGGAGVSTLAEFLPGGSDAFRMWPAPRIHEGPGVVILVCRTHTHGLTCARHAVQQWRESDVPDGLLLAGLIAVADAPGKLPRPQAEMLRLVEGSVPRMWSVPWVAELRAVQDLSSLPLPPSLVQLSIDLDAIRHPSAALW